MAFHYDFRRVETRQGLLDIIGIDNDTFEAVLAFKPLNSTLPGATLGEIQIIQLPLFTKHSIPKRNKARGYRVVWEPLLVRSQYKALARRLDSFFRLCLPNYPHDCAFGYRVGRNIRENAKEHSGHTYLLKLDIENFFTTISQEVIFNSFMTLNLHSEISDLLSRFVTIDGVLPLGLPTSPVISNAIALPIDIELHRLAQQVGNVTYTRYADDLSFSGEGNLPTVEEIQKCVNASGFTLAHAKTHWSKIGRSHYVTGLSVSDAKQPHIPRAKKHTLRQELYYATKFGINEHAHRKGNADVQGEINRLDGLVKFVSHHEPRLSGKLKNQWREILLNSGMRPSFAPKNQHRLPFTIFVDEAEFDGEEGKFLAIGMSVSQHHGIIMSAGAEVLASERSDVWAAGDFEAVRKRGLHFTDATEDLKLKYISRLASMPFEGYVAFDRLGDSADYSTVYIRLLDALISRRLMAAESQMVGIYFEENSKISRELVKSCVERAYEALKVRNDRRPRAYGVEFVRKPNFGISIPDFLLGTLGKYLKSAPSAAGRPERRERLLFERLRDKYRVILDLKGRIEYSRRRPIAPWRP